MRVHPSTGDTPATTGHLQPTASSSFLKFFVKRSEILCQTYRLLPAVVDC